MESKCKPQGEHQRLLFPSKKTDANLHKFDSSRATKGAVWSQVLKLVVGASEAKHDT